MFIGHDDDDNNYEFDNNFDRRALLVMFEELESPITKNIAKTRSFPGADIGSDHELVMMTFKLHLKRAKIQCNTRIRFDLEKLKDPEVAEIFQAKIEGKFAALSILDSDMDMDMLTDTFNTAVTGTANEILGKYRPVKKSWVTTVIPRHAQSCIITEPRETQKCLMSLHPILREEVEATVKSLKKGKVSRSG